MNLLPPSSKHRSTLLCGSGYILPSLMILLLCSGLSAASSEGFVVSSPEKNPAILLDSKASSILKYAVKDFVEDSYECTGKAYQVLDSIPKNDLVVILPLVVDQSPVLKYLEEQGRVDTSSLRGKWESFLIQPVHNPLPGIQKGLVVVGSDPRGAMYGLYEASERLFGTDPMKFWTEKKAKHKEVVIWEDGPITVGPPTYRFRGFFINDEDSLLSWRGENADRVVEAEVYAEILETICRLKGNLIAPAMYADYMDEKSRKLTHDRGLYYTASHLEILLANPSTHYWNDFTQKNFGEKLAYSFVRYTDEMGEFWLDSIERNRGYLNIWPLGLRSQDDRDFVETDSSAPKTLEGRAELTAGAIGFQQKLLRENSKISPPLTSVTMRGEVLPQYKTGKMGVPNDAILVWQDAGSTATMPYLPDANEQGRPGGNGVYYHLTYCDNQWTQWVPLQLVRDEFCKMLAHKVDRYVLFNVGDIREIPLTIAGAMDLAWDAKPWVTDPKASDKYISEWITQQFGKDAAAELIEVYNRYYELEYSCRATSVVEMVAPYTISGLIAPIWPNVSTTKLMEKGGDLESLREHCSKANFSSPIARYGQSKLAHWLSVESEWDSLYEKAMAAGSNVPKDRKQFFFDNMILQIQTSRMVNHWAIAVAKAFEACGEGKYALAADCFNEAAASMHAIVNDRRKASHGKWNNWFRGEYHNGWEHSLWALKPELHASDAEKLSDWMKQFQTD